MALAMQSLPYVYKLPNGTYIHITMRQYGGVALLGQALEDFNKDMNRLNVVESAHLTKYKVERESIEGTVEIDGIIYSKVPLLKSVYPDENVLPDFSDDYFSIMWKWGTLMSQDPNVRYHSPGVSANSYVNEKDPCIKSVGTYGDIHKMCTWSLIDPD